MTEHRLRICLVASEILGAFKNGGIGTATTHLALLLARAGHAVHFVYTGAAPIAYGSVWAKRCEAAGITLTNVDSRSHEIYPIWLRESCVVFDYLRSSEHDVILFQDWEGAAFSSVIAKKAGLAFDSTSLAIFAHGPTAWLLDANRTLAREPQTLAQLHMERVAFALADAVVSPSRYMLKWLRENGELTSESRATAIPLYLWADPDEDQDLARESALEQVTTFAFFGRLETRKGVNLFLDAILSERLASLTFDVVFVGKPASHSPDQIIDVIAQRRPSLLGRVSFHTDLDTDQAQTFLRDHRCLAVIPSLVDNAPCVISECLRRRIPFLSTLTGGIAELVEADDVPRVLVAPQADALAQRLAVALTESFEPARPAYREGDIAGRWLDWFETLASHKPTKAPTSLHISGATCNIAVVVTHYERPSLLQQTLESLASQTQTDFEVVLVDDGSTSSEARSALDLVERRAWPFDIKVVRQTNHFLGAARNAGIKATRADRIIFMDDDNAAFPNLVETLNTAQTRTGADIVTCQMSIFRHPIDAPDPNDLHTAELWGFSGGPIELGLSVNCFGDATGIYRRTVFERIGFFHEQRGVGFEDWHLHARAALAGLSILSLPIPLYWYRRVPTGMLMATDLYTNNKVIWGAYASALPGPLRRLVDLSVRNELLFTAP